MEEYNERENHQRKKEQKSIKERTQVEQPRIYDRHSQDGRKEGKGMKKQGAGKFNWGNINQQEQYEYEQQQEQQQQQQQQEQQEQEQEQVVEEGMDYKEYKQSIKKNTHSQGENIQSLQHNQQAIKALEEQGLTQIHPKHNH